MASLSTFAEVAALAGDPARAGMLHALMDGRALTASELAHVAGITPQTASGHLARMAVAGLLRVEKQGRHRYHRLASSAVAQMLESIMQVASGLGATRPPVIVGPRDAALRTARTCYDHLAGRLGVALADALVEAGHVELTSDGGLVTDAGIEFFARIGIDLDAITTRRGKRSARILCRPCLD
jgi:DNA-binding transcriptional ArsR family regulator